MHLGKAREGAGVVVFGADVGGGDGGKFLQVGGADGGFTLEGLPLVGAWALGAGDAFEGLDSGLSGVARLMDIDAGEAAVGAQNDPGPAVAGVG